MMQALQGMNGTPATVTVLRHNWSNFDLHTVTRTMKRQAVEDLLVIFVGRAR
jgi:hypothetical protein